MAGQTNVEEEVPVTETAASPTGPVTETPSHLQPPQVWVDLEADADDDDSAMGNSVTSSTNSLRSSIMEYRQINGRRYHHDAGEQYWGPNDDRQNTSLDIGHHALTILLDDKLYLAPLPEHIDKAIDIGTGTGIWAIDFADMHPEATVIGTDISPIQPEWVPPNVFFQIDDFSKPWTFEENSVDYIHVRWLSGCVQDWTKLFKEAFRVLKPGGYIESYEFDSNVSSDDGSVTEKMALSQWGDIYTEGTKKLGFPMSYHPVGEGRQHNGLKDAGFVDIVEKTYKLPLSDWPKDERQRQVGAYTHATFANDLEGFIGLMVTQLGWTPTEISVYCAVLRREWRNPKVHAYFPGRVAYAQKPK